MGADPACGVGFIRAGAAAAGLVADAPVIALTGAGAGTGEVTTVLPSAGACVGGMALAGVAAGARFMGVGAAAWGAVRACAGPGATIPDAGFNGADEGANSTSSVIVGTIL